MMVFGGILWTVMFYFLAALWFGDTIIKLLLYLQRDAFIKACNQSKEQSRIRSVNTKGSCPVCEARDIIKGKTR